MRKPLMPVTREQAEDLSIAHAEGYHADFPREFCPDCDDRPLSAYPPACRYRACTRPALDGWTHCARHYSAGRSR
jgi:hypothetical protein